MTDSAPIGLACVCLLSLAVWLVAMLGGHIVQNGLSPVIHAVSEFGAVEGSRYYIAVCWWCAALCGASLCISQALLLNDNGVLNNADAIVGVIMLAIYCPARILTWMFPCPIRQVEEWDATHKPVPVPSTRIDNILHLVFAVISFGSVVAASRTLGSAFNNLPSNTSLYNDREVSNGLSYAMIGALGLTVLGRRFNMVGLWERVFYALQMTWFGWAAGETIHTSINT